MARIKLVRSIFLAAGALLLSTATAIAIEATTAVAGGAPLWVEHVTASQRLSIWTNKAQMEDEAMHPSLPRNKTHPWVVQTRWNVTPNIKDAPPGVAFVIIEIGSVPFCGTSTCADDGYVLFGLSTVNGVDTQLHSYHSNATAGLLAAIHANATDVDTVIPFSNMKADDVSIVYKFFPGNSSFYGVGGGPVAGGGRIEVRELIARNLVAPLEVFYTPQGKVITEYITPLRYVHDDTN